MEENLMTLEAIFASVLSVPLQNITDNSSPKNLKNWNSLRHIQLVTKLELHYGIKFTHTEIVSLNSLVDIREILQNKGVEI
jgi:acyl carrier protein